ncbi:MAG: dTDP-4-amino-4,6-dideoxygalactose transaminase [Acidobacteria bacterium]|nr:dTDP-4-amino-4,6-dideoxygalactose transaminase [Acidobacteriota bacterium]
MKIPSNRSYLTGRELAYVAETLTSGAVSSDGRHTRECSRLLESRFGIPKVLMTPSCSSALEIAASLCGLGPGDEVILPSFTFVSTANAFVRLGARPVFVDIRRDTLNLDETKIERAVTARTRAVFVVHYAGTGCEMDAVMAVARRHNLLVVEDAAQGVDAFYKGRALGSVGHLGAYSFHHTKNYSCGEGGALCVNSPALAERAEIIRDKGTNRGKFLRGEVDKYTWVDVGSSHIPSEVACALLRAQLEAVAEITVRRRRVCELYDQHLRPLARRGLLRLPHAPEGCLTNGHIYYVTLPDGETRDALLTHLNANGVAASSHYVPLHDSPMGRRFGYRKGDLPVTEEMSARILRLPVYPDLTEMEQAYVVRQVSKFLHGAKVGDAKRERLLAAGTR